MPTVIDALVITLGLDPANFTKGQKQVANDLLKTRNAGSSAVKDLEAGAQKAANAFASLRNEVAGLALVLVGASGIKDFVAGMLTGEASAGRLADNLGLGVQRLSEWQMAARSVGGASVDADSALGRLQQIYQNRTFRGDTGQDANLRRLGITDYSQIADSSEALLKLSEAASRMPKPEFQYFARALGINDNMINLLEKGRTGLEQLLAVEAKHGAITAKDAQAAQDLQAALADLSNTIQGDLRPAVTDLATGMTGLLKDIDPADTKPAIIGIIGAIGIAAAIANPEVVGLAIAIGGLARAYELLESKTGRARIHNNIAENEAFLSHLWGAIHAGHGDVGKTQAAVGQVIGDAWAGKYRTDNTGGWGSEFGTVARGQRGPGGASGMARYMRYFQAQGFSAAQAAGIAAGISAEGGGLGMSQNGAFGLGQWRGDRYKNLVKQFGAHPNELAQLQFLTWELKGGDPGGAAVRGAGDSDMALLAYVYKFMRPQGRNGEHMRDAIADMSRGRRALSGAAAAGISVGTINITLPNVKNGHDFANQLGAATKRKVMVVQSQSGMSG